MKEKKKTQSETVEISPVHQYPQENKHESELLNTEIIIIFKI